MQGFKFASGKKSHTVLPSCDTQQRETCRKHTVLGISSAGTSYGFAGWPHARHVHSLVSLELRVALGLVNQQITDTLVWVETEVHSI